MNARASALRVRRPPRAAGGRGLVPVSVRACEPSAVLEKEET